MTVSSQAGIVPVSRNRALFVNFFRRELVTRYLGSTSALLWAFLQPLLLLAVYHFVFTSVFRASAFGGTSFLLFVAVALWPWLAAQDGLIARDRRHTGLWRADPQSRVSARDRRLCIGRGDVRAAARRLSRRADRALRVRRAGPLRRPAARDSRLGDPCPGVTGVALALAALQVFVRDVEHVLAPLLTILMYLTPILYPLAMVPEGVRPWVAANPFGWLVDRLRDALLEGRFAPRWGDAVALAVALAMFAAGRWIFRRLSPHFEDFV